jgi:hypothetical protein
LEASLGKKFKRPDLNRKKLGMVTHTCYPSYSGKHEWDCSPGYPGKKGDSISKITRGKKSLEAWLKQ